MIATRSSVVSTICAVLYPIGLKITITHVSRTVCFMHSLLFLPITSRHLDFIDRQRTLMQNIIMLMFPYSPDTRSLAPFLFYEWRTEKKTQNNHHSRVDSAVKPMPNNQLRPRLRLTLLRLQSIIPRSIIIHYNILFKYDLTEMSVCLTVEEIIFHSVVVCCDGAQE